MSWADLFERAEEYQTDPETVRETLAARREETGDTADATAESEGDDA